jgi:8-oxo-dGTP pyrophosphatase MutT (NUDIX family)
MAEHYMWKTVSSRELFNHPRLCLIEDEVILPSGTKTKYLKYKDDGSCSTAVIAVRKDGKILLQKETSYPLNKRIFQFPGGAVPAGEKPKAGANRELMEEAGYRAKKMKLLGSYLINNRRSTALDHVFLATDLEKMSLEGDEEEDIEVFWFTEKQIEKMIKKNKIITGHALAAYCFYKLRK